MYNEIDIVLTTIQNIKRDVTEIIVIQSDPGDVKNYLDDSLVNHYELLPDIALSSKDYQNERKQGGLSTIPAKALSRNCSRGFQIANSLNVDWWIFILGDVMINNLSGIKKIINKMEKQNKVLGITRPIGQTLYNANGKLTHLVTLNMTTFTPTFFIVHSSLIQKGLFTDIKITNPYASEQCFGDSVNEFFMKNKIIFQNSTFFISDNAYPDFIKGLKYNYPKSKTPKLLRPTKNYLKKFLNF
ncbi:MAG: hypothetical protein K5793_07755 [Nitrosarchaeum sp.]|nr:hypothetical protein [Nitrosarchaeum sp.]